MEFKEYYKYYLTLHQNKWNRRLHALGQITTLLFIALSVQEQQWFLLLWAPFIIYPFAWSGHFFFEKNKPAAWSKPLWAKACDWLMLRDMITGKVER
jgi:hypothetical protein